MKRQHTARISAGAFALLLLTTALIPLFPAALATGAPIVTDAAGDNANDGGSASDIIGVAATTNATHLSLYIDVAGSAHPKLIYYHVAFSAGGNAYTAFASYGTTGTISSAFAAGQPTTANFSANAMRIDVARANIGSPAEGDQLTGVVATTKHGSSGVQFDTTSAGTYRVGNSNAPVLAPIGNKAVAENALLSFTVTASDGDVSDTLTLSSSALPAGASFNVTSGAFAWTPDFTQAGNYAIEFSVTDGDNADSESITITVANTNRAPVLDAIGDKALDEADTVAFTLSATDADGDAITYAHTGLPAGATLDASTGAFSWTPDYAQAGAHAITFVASDGTDSDNEAITITVGNVNRAPVLDAIGDKTVAEAATLAFNVTASDADAEGLTFVATGLPAGASFNTSSGAFAWTPDFSAAGSYSVDFLVSDGEDTDNETVSITVTNVNRAPVLDAIGNQTVDENVALAFTLTGSDADGDVVSFSADALPSGATLNLTSGEFAWTPDFTQSGLYVVTFTATDGSLDASEAVNITVVQVNQAPDLEPVADATLNEAESLAFTLVATDFDMDTLVFNVTGLPAGATFNTTTGAFSWDTTYADSGVYALTFSATDGDASDSEDMTITVVNVNRAPVLDPIGNKEVNETAALAFQVTASDPDEQALTLTVDGLPAGAAFDAATGNFSWTPTYDDAGSYSLTFNVTDGDLQDSETILISVGNVNRAPVLDAIGDKAGLENATLAFTVTTSDPDADPVTLSVANLPAGATFDAQTGEFSWTPTFDQAGGYTVNFTASDGDLSDEESIVINITNVNRAPVLAAIGDKSVAEGFGLNFSVSASDVDGDAVTISTSALPTGAAFNASVNKFSWVPNHTQAGTYSVTFTATDGDLSDEETIEIVVANTNRVPVFIVLDDQMVNESEEMLFTVAATDADGQALTYTMDLVEAGASLNATTGVFAWTPDFTQAGTYPVTFTASDSEDESTWSIVLTVVNVNRAPVLPNLANQTITEGDAVELNVAASDLDGDELTYNLFGLPEAASINATGVLHWATTTVDAGTYGVLVQVTDGESGDSKFFTITVQEFGGPSIAAIADISVLEGETIGLTLDVADPDEDVLTLTTSALPEGATFDNVTGEFAWATTFLQSGSYSVTFTASDGTFEDSITVQMYVLEDNAPPLFGSHADQETIEGTLLSFQLNASDVDGDALTFSGVGLPAGASVSASGVFTWTPTLDQAGEYDVTVQVTDGTKTDETTIHIIVLDNVAPVPTWRTVGLINAGSPTSFTAAGTQDPDGHTPLVYEWDFNAADGFQVEATGRDVTHTFASPGSKNVTLRVRDDAGAEATLTQQIEVDDYITVDIQVLESAPDRGTATLAKLRVATWDDQGIAGAVVKVTVFYQPTPASTSRVIRTMDITVDATGELTFPIPRDTSAGNLVGGHFVTALVTVATSMYGNQETGSDRESYTVGLN